MKDKRRSISDLWAMSGAFLERKRLNVQVHFEEKKKGNVEVHRRIRCVFMGKVQNSNPDAMIWLKLEGQMEI